MKLTKILVGMLVASSGLASAANVVYAGTALTNIQGTTAVDLTAGKLGLVIADTTGNGFGALSGTMTSTAAGLLVGGTFGGDLILARSSSAAVGDSSMGGAFTWNLTVAPANTQWAVVWFETLLASDATTEFAPGNAKYGMAAATSWVTPSTEPGAGQNLSYSATPTGGAPLKMAMNNGGSSGALPAGALFATNGTTLSVIPEPSAALLGALGALGLLRRRRI